MATSYKRRDKTFQARIAQLVTDAKRGPTRVQRKRIHRRESDRALVGAALTLVASNWAYSKGRYTLPHTLEPLHDALYELGYIA